MSGYVPLERRRLGGEYAARRALFLQSYRFSVDGRREQRGELGRRLRAAVARAGAGLAAAWSGWLSCFGPTGHHRKYYLHGYA